VSQPRQTAPILAGSSVVIGSVSRPRGTVLRLLRLTPHSTGVRWADLDFGLDPANGPGDEGDDDVSQPPQGLVTRKHHDRPTTLLFQLKPADLAARYHGSSRIASRALARAQASSVGSVFDPGVAAGPWVSVWRP
jgi:hypothetical protein